MNIVNESLTECSGWTGSILFSTSKPYDYWYIWIYSFQTNKIWWRLARMPSGPVEAVQNPWARVRGLKWTTWPGHRSRQWTHQCCDEKLRWYAKCVWPGAEKTQDEENWTSCEWFKYPDWCLAYVCSTLHHIMCGSNVGGKNWVALPQFSPPHPVMWCIL